MAKAQRAEDAPRTPEEVTDYNDRVWDMVLYKVHPVALFVLLQIILFSRLTGHPGLSGLSFGIFLVQFLAAWSVLQGTLLRDMGFTSLAPLCLVGWSILGLIFSFLFGDPLSWPMRGLHVGLLVYLGPMLLVWITTLLRWRRLKRQHFEEDAVERA